MTKSLLAAASLLFSQLAFAAAHTGAISSATAGSGRAAVDASESPFLNPATLPYLHGYFFTSSYNADSLKSSDMAFSLTDNMKDTLIPTSVGYLRKTVQASGVSSQIVSQDIRLALAEQVAAKYSFGLAIHNKNDRSDLESYSQTNATLAGVTSITDSLSAALVFDDFIPASGSVPESLRLKNLTSLGASYNYKKVIRAKLDLVSATNNSFAKPSLLGGVESFWNKWLILRLGLGRDAELDSNIYSAGVGFQGPKFGIHYSYLSRQEDQNSFRHTVDLAIPVW